MVEHSGVRVVTLEFPNRSRSFDESRNGVRFVGHDGMFQIHFFVEAAALATSGAAMRGTGALETKCLSAFDALRTSIHEVARKAYSHRRSDTYTLTADHFR